MLSTLYRCGCRCLLVLLLALGHSEAMPPEWNLPSMPSSWVLNAGSAHRCVRIPDSIELCSDIGYSEMRLPNMLNHDTVKEVADQTKPWVPLAKLACHREIRVLLCSIYAPVCIQQLPDRQIKPCRSLCEAVMRPCAVVMENFGFSWPEILNCTQFPPDSDLMCIKSSMDLPSKSSAECHACPERATYESIIGNYCVNKVVFKARIDRVLAESGGRTQLQLKRRLRFFKTTGLGREQKRQLRTVTMDTSGCKCRSLEAATSDPTKKFLMMGTVSPRDGGVTVTHLVEWQQRSRPFKQAMRQIRAVKKRGEAAICRVSQLQEPPLLPVAAPSVAPGGPGKKGKRGKNKKNKGNRGGGGRRNKNRKNGGAGNRKKRKNPGGSEAGATGEVGEGGRKRRRQRPRDERGRPYSYEDAFYYSNYQS